MSQWIDRVQNHSVWKRLEALGPTLDAALQQESIDPSGTAAIERLRAILTFTGKRLASTEPQLIALAPLDAIDSAIASVIVAVENYQSTGSLQHLVSANDHADASLAQLAIINYPVSADDLIALRDSAVAYRTTLEHSAQKLHEVTSSVTAEAANVRSRLDDLAASVDAESTRLASLGTGFEATFASAEESRAQRTDERIQAALTQLAQDVSAIQQRQSELASDITAERTKLTTVLTEFQSQFSAAQEARSRESADAQTARQDKFAALMAEYTQKLVDQSGDFSKRAAEEQVKFEEAINSLRQDYITRADVVLEQIDTHKKKVEDLVGVIGNLGVTSGYQKTANYAKNAMMFWQGVAVAAMLAVIGFAFKVFLPVLELNQQYAEFNWTHFASRLVLLVPVGVLAAYASAQADRHNETERRNRKLALELEAIGPYLAPLPAEQQQTFILQLADRTFGREEPISARKSGKKSPATSVDLTAQLKDLIRETVAEAVKAAK